MRNSSSVTKRVFENIWLKWVHKRVYFGIGISLKITTIFSYAQISISPISFSRDFFSLREAFRWVLVLWGALLRGCRAHRSWWIHTCIHDVCSWSLWRCPRSSRSRWRGEISSPWVHDHDHEPKMRIQIYRLWDTWSGAWQSLQRREWAGVWIDLILELKQLYQEKLSRIISRASRGPWRV